MLNSFPKRVVETYEVKHIIDESFYNVIRPLMSIYLTADFMHEMLSFQFTNSDVRVKSAEIITYHDTYLMEYIQNNKVQETYEAFSQGQSVGSSLMEYDCLVVHNSGGNSFNIIRIDNAFHFEYLRNCLPLKPQSGQQLMQELKKLTKKHIFVGLDATFYNENTNEFRIFNYNEVGFFSGSTLEEFYKCRDNYLESYSKILLSESPHFSWEVFLPH